MSPVLSEVKIILVCNQDDEIVQPALNAARARGLDVTGLVGTDSLLAEWWDNVLVARCHNQAHKSSKAMALHASFVITTGTQILFGSVAHVCAQDIAGEARALQSALINAASPLAAHITSP